MLIPFVVSTSLYSGQVLAGEELYTNSVLEVKDSSNKIIESINITDGNFEITLDLEENEKFTWHINGNKAHLPTFEVFSDEKTFDNYQIYALATCKDRVKNQDESDIDCGGSCGTCQIAMQCNSNTDCLFDCVNGFCSAQKTPTLVLFDIEREENSLFATVGLRDDQNYQLKKQLEFRQNNKSSKFNIFGYKNEITLNSLSEFDFDFPFNVTLELEDKKQNYSFKHSKEFVFYQKYNADAKPIEYKSNLIIEMPNKKVDFNIELKGTNNLSFENISSMNTFTVSNKEYDFKLVSNDFDLLSEFQIESNQLQRYKLEFFENSIEGFEYGIDLNQLVTICPKNSNMYICKNNCKSLIKITSCTETQASIAKIDKTKKKQINFVENEPNGDFHITNDSYKAIVLAIIIAITIYLCIELFYDGRGSEFLKKIFKRRKKKNVKDSKTKDIKFKQNEYIEVEKKKTENKVEEKITVVKESRFSRLCKNINKSFNQLLVNISLKSINVKELEKKQEKVDEAIIVPMKRDNKHKGIPVNHLNKYYSEIVKFFDKYRYLKEDALIAHIKKSKLNRHFLIDLYNLCNASRFNGNLAKKHVPEMEINKLKLIPETDVQKAFKIMIFYYYVNKMNQTYTRYQVLEFIHYNFTDVELIYNVVDNLKHK